MPTEGKVSKIQEGKDDSEELPDWMTAIQTQCFSQLGRYREHVKRHNNEVADEEKPFSGLTVGDLRGCMRPSWRFRAAL